MIQCRPATLQDRHRAFAQIFEQWPHADDLEVHLLKRRSSIQHRRAKWFVLSDDSDVLASCGSYPITLFGPDETRKARGFGAVFTQRDHRGKGYAAKLLSYVMDYHQLEGISDFILFSDIAPRYYEQLGFHRLHSWGWELNAQELPLESGWTLQATKVLPQNAGRLDCFYGIQRSKKDDVWCLAKQNDKLRKVDIIDNDRKATGFWLLSSRDGDTYQLLESNMPQGRAHWELFRTFVAADAFAAGCKKAKGWWTSGRAPETPSADITSRQSEILMWASRKSSPDAWLPRITEEGFRAFPIEHF